jgi:fructokinase
MPSTAQLDVLALGELLIDMVAEDIGDLVGATSFHKAAGGAPANVAVGAVRLGRQAGFVGCVGDDPFGRFLRQTLEREGVATDGLRTTKEAPTTLALVSRAASGERDFQFYRSPGADTLLAASMIDDDLLRRAKILHVGSLSMTHEPARGATLHAITRAQEGGALVSVDPNLRPPLWNGDLERARREMTTLIAHANILKISEEELAFVTGATAISTGVAQLWHDTLYLAIVTMGEGGCWFRSRNDEGHIDGFAVQAIDTTGAGDSFVAGVLSLLLELHVDVANPDPATLRRALRLANAAGALTTTALGAIPALPRMEAVLRLAEGV